MTVYKVKTCALAGICATIPTDDPGKQPKGRFHTLQDAVAQKRSFQKVAAIFHMVNDNLTGWIDDEQAIFGQPFLTGEKFEGRHRQIDPYLLSNSLPLAHQGIDIFRDTNARAFRPVY